MNGGFDSNFVGRSSWLALFYLSGCNQDVRDLKQVYWLSGFREAVTEFMAKFQNCEQVKYEHEGPTSLH